jgi:hypothetical protein
MMAWATVLSFSGQWRVRIAHLSLSWIRSVMLRMGWMAYDQLVLPWYQTKLLCSVVVVCLALRDLAVVVVVRKYFGERNRHWLGRAE